MSWTGDNRVAIASALRAYRKKQTTETAVQVLSVYYSALGTTFKRWRQSPWFLHLLPQMLWYRHRIIYYLDNFIDCIPPGHIGTVLSPDMLDVVATVVWRLRLVEYHNMVWFMLMRMSTRTDMDTHTKAFLWMHRVRYEIEKNDDDFRSGVLGLGEAVASEASALLGADAQARFGQASRIFRQLAEFAKSDNSLYTAAITRARQCAETGGVTDQLLKLT